MQSTHDSGGGNTVIENKKITQRGTVIAVQIIGIDKMHRNPIVHMPGTRTTNNISKRAQHIQGRNGRKSKLTNIEQIK